MAVNTMLIDTGHSSIEFAATYAMNSIIKGRFLRFSGLLDIDPDDPASSSVSVEIDAGSVTSDNPERDAQLRGSDFFDVESNEQLTFESSSVEVLENGHWRVSGDLTILGHSRPVSLDSRFYGIVEDANGISRAGFVAETDIQRSDWDMTWNAEQDTGVLVSDRVRISLYISAIPAGDEEVGEESDDDEAEVDTTGANEN